MRLTLSIKIFDDKGKELASHNQVSTANAFQKNAARLPGLTGKAFYDLRKSRGVRINTPDGHIEYRIKETL